METYLEASYALKRSTGVDSYWLTIFNKMHVKAVAKFTLWMHDLLLLEDSYLQILFYFHTG